MKNYLGATLWARQTLDSEIFINKPDKWFKIWFYIVSNANYEDTKLFKRGEFFTSYEYIKQGTGATVNQIDQFVRWAKRTIMITTRKTTRGLVIFVLNYDKYQNIESYRTTRKTMEATKWKRNGNDTIQNKVINKEEYTLSANADEGETWNWEGYLESFTGKRHLEIIRDYWKHKGIKLSNREQAGAEIKRLVKVASELTAWKPEQIEATMKELDNMKLAGGWGLEAVARNIARISAGGYSKVEEFPDWYTEQDKRMRRAGYGVRIRPEDGKHVYFL